MAKTVVGLIDNSSEAERTLEELLGSGFDRGDIGIISPEIGKEAAAALAGGSRGIVYGGLGGMLLGAVALAIPGIGPVMAAGPALPLLGAVFGAIAGGLVGGITGKGIPEADAHFYAEGVRRGATLIIVNAKDDELAQRALEIMKRHGAVELDQRAEQWAKQGWNRRFTESEPSRATAESAGSSSGITPADAPVQDVEAAEPVRPRAVSDRTASFAASPAFDLSAVRVYSFEIEIPEDVQAANESRYTGPERRFQNVPFSHSERRKVA
jgi:hypothetical protein